MKRLLSALVVLTALWLPAQARAQSCPSGTQYRFLWDEHDGEDTITHYSCVDLECLAEVDREAAAAQARCDELKDRILRFPEVEAHLDRVTADQLQRIRQDVVADVMVVLQEIEHAGMGGSLDSEAQDSLGADLARMRSVLLRGGDFRELQPFAGRVNRIISRLGLADLASDLAAAWRSLQRLIQAETDAELLRAMLDSRKLSLELQLTGCGRKVSEVKERGQGCSRAW